MREGLQQYVKRVQDLSEHVRGNEQATKQSLVGPLFTSLGYDLTDPRECIPEYRVDFGPNRSVKPIDWAFFQNARPIFFVEAKEVGKKLGSYDEQLADYFAKSPDARLGILTNGIQWRFFTDAENSNIMDKEPFLKWDVLTDENPPLEFLSLLQRSQYNTQLITTFAKRKRAQSLLVSELNRILEPSTEFVRLAIANLESRKAVEKVVEEWKPLLASALSEWARQKTLSMVLETTTRPEGQGGSGGEVAAGKAIVTTEEELASLETVRRLLGPNRIVAYEDTTAYFKIHLPERNTWAVCRLYLGSKRRTVWVPLPAERVRGLAPGFTLSSPQAGWTCINLGSTSDIEGLGDVLRASWDSERESHFRGADDGVEDSEESRSGNDANRAEA
jgi:hypothetical protein